ncbi:hypothetical protein GJ496_004263 [Pomphorhynchus laevis]|nr:hypothetical protein GJ496_004263 [Pomphorhynchus laevis]
MIAEVTLITTSEFCRAFASVVRRTVARAALATSTTDYRRYCYALLTKLYNREYFRTIAEVFHSISQPSSLNISSNYF